MAGAGGFDDIRGRALVLKEEYSPGYGKALVESFAGRTVRVEAAFFTPYLRADMRLLDGLLEQFSAKALAAKIATPEELPRLIEACRTWGRDPTAFDAIIWCEIVGRKV
jgi:hypothetical protein